MNKQFNPVLHNQVVALYPLVEADFEQMCSVASDPKIWEQHPHKTRWQEEVYRTFFETSLDSNGAFKIVDQETGKVIGGTRFYEYNESQASIAIGGTFYASKYWGTGRNALVKKLMLDYIFNYVTTVYFYIDQYNKRSQMAIERLGAVRIGEQPVDGAMIDFIYRILKEDWLVKPGNTVAGV